MREAVVTLHCWPRFSLRHCLHQQRTAPLARKTGSVLRQLLMIRAVAEVAGADPDPLFTFFTSKAGFKVIDPACTNHEDPPFRQWSERQDLSLVWGTRRPLQIRALHDKGLYLISLAGPLSCI